MQYGRKAVWSIPYVSVAFFPSLKQNSIAYRSSKMSSRPDCIFEIHQLWQSDYSKVYSNPCCSCRFEPEIIKIGQSSHNMYSYNIVNFQESTTILNACTKKSGDILNAPRIYMTVMDGLCMVFILRVKNNLFSISHFTSLFGGVMARTAASKSVSSNCSHAVTFTFGLMPLAKLWNPLFYQLSVE